MGRAPCCDKANVKRGPWSPEEDMTLRSYVHRHGTGGNWIALPHKAGLKRCGKSCRLRWLNYLRPDIKHGGFTEEEDNIICNLYNNIGSRWSVIASQLPGRTDNDIKNYWNTKLKKKLLAAKNNNKNNNNTNNTIHPINSTQSPASMAKVGTDNYGSSTCFDTNSITLPYPMELSYQQQRFDPQKIVYDSIQYPLPRLMEDSIQYPLPRLMEVSDLGTSNNYSVSSSQEVSSLSDSSPLGLMDSHGSSLSGSGVGIEDIDGFLMDFGFEFPYDILNGFDVQK